MSFQRDEAVETAALRLGYTEQDIKRKTLSQLRRELAEAGIDADHPNLPEEPATPRGSLSPLFESESPTHLPDHSPTHSSVQSSLFQSNFSSPPIAYEMAETEEYDIQMDHVPQFDQQEEEEEEEQQEYVTLPSHSSSPGPSRDDAPRDSSENNVHVQEVKQGNQDYGLLPFDLFDNVQLLPSQTTEPSTSPPRSQELPPPMQPQRARNRVKTKPPRAFAAHSRSRSQSQAPARQRQPPPPQTQRRIRVPPSRPRTSTRQQPNPHPQRQPRRQVRRVDQAQTSQTSQTSQHVDRRPRVLEKRHLPRQAPRMEVLQPTRPSLSAFQEDEDEISRLDSLHRMYLAKVRFTSQLEKDPDFTADDLKEWRQSIETMKKKLKGITSTRVGDLKEKWQRRQAKLAEMEQLGVLEPELARLWAEKQRRLYDLIVSTESEKRRQSQEGK